MDKYGINSWAKILLTISEIDIRSRQPLPEALKIETEGYLDVYYAPFDFVHREARLVVVGITPGRTQAVEALLATRRALVRGMTVEEACRVAKRQASFAGAMRKNLVDMIDFVGLSKWLGVRSASELFHLESSLTHTTSAFRNPVFFKGDNYSRQIRLGNSELLRRTARELLGRELELLRDAAVIPLGPAAEEAVLYAMRERSLTVDRVLTGMPHPSGANAERIAYLLGRKARAALSVKTDPDKIDRARERLLRTVAGL